MTYSVIFYGNGYGLWQDPGKYPKRSFADPDKYRAILGKGRSTFGQNFGLEQNRSFGQSGQGPRHKMRSFGMYGQGICGAAGARLVTYLVVCLRVQLSVTLLFLLFLLE